MTSGYFAKKTLPIKSALKKIFHFSPAGWSKGEFIMSTPKAARILDVGCGNGSPQWTKSIRPDVYYVGVDVGDYNQSINPVEVADEYIVTSGENFAAKLEEFRGSFDAVISSHNIEHCDDAERVLRAMLDALKPGGKIYLSFPCEESVSFPRRGGCLNFYDDQTHQKIPSWDSILRTIQTSGCSLSFVAKRHRPLRPAFRGLLLEPYSALSKNVIPDGSTWALYGFESIIWASAPDLPVILSNWGPKETLEGEHVNLQPSGHSAIWVQASNVNPFGAVWLEFGGIRPAIPAFVNGDVVTSEVPSEIIHSAGIHDVVMVEHSRRRTNLGNFIVYPIRNNSK